VAPLWSHCLDGEQQRLNPDAHETCADTNLQGTEEQVRAGCTRSNCIEDANLELNAHGTERIIDALR
jgi:hypothetical protein